MPGGAFWHEDRCPSHAFARFEAKPQPFPDSLGEAVHGPKGSGSGVTPSSPLAACQAWRGGGGGLSVHGPCVSEDRGRVCLVDSVDELEPRGELIGAGKLGDTEEAPGGGWCAVLVPFPEQF